MCRKRSSGERIRRSLKKIWEGRSLRSSQLWINPSCGTKGEHTPPPTTSAA
jgi:hypothetical protein